MIARARPTRRDEGSATLEVAILAPVLLLVVFTVVQVALWSYARSVALGAAQEGVAAARLVGSSAAAGRREATDFLARAGDSVLGAQVAVTATSTEVVVRVRGHALSVLPGVPGLPVEQSARGPVERFTRP